MDILWKIWYLELRRRGFAVYVGKLNEAETDFIAIDHSKKVYIQVCYFLRDPVTEEREIRPLQMINDNHHKIVIVMESSLNQGRDGISEIGLREFLTGAEI